MNKRKTGIWPKAIRDRFATAPCAICGHSIRMTVDHIIPLAKGGSNDVSNLQPLCQPCNLHKGARLSQEEMVAWHSANRPAIEASRVRLAKILTSPDSF